MQGFEPLLPAGVISANMAGQPRIAVQDSEGPLGLRLAQETRLLEGLAKSKNYREFSISHFHRIVTALFVGDDSTRHRPLFQQMQNDADRQCLLNFLDPLGFFFQLTWRSYQYDNRPQFFFPVDLLPAQTRSELLSGLGRGLYQGKVVYWTNDIAEIRLSILEFFLFNLVYYVISATSQGQLMQPTSMEIYEQVLLWYLEFFLGAPKPDPSVPTEKPVHSLYENLTPPSQRSVLNVRNCDELDASWIFISIVIDIWFDNGGDVSNGHPNPNPALFGSNARPGQRGNTRSSCKPSLLQIRCLKAVVAYCHLLRLQFDHVIELEENIQQVERETSSKRRQFGVSARPQAIAYPPIHYDKILDLLSRPLYEFIIAALLYWPTDASVLELYDLWSFFVQPWVFDANPSLEYFVPLPSLITDFKPKRPQSVDVNAYVQEKESWYRDFVERNFPCYSMGLKAIFKHLNSALARRGSDSALFVEGLLSLMTLFGPPLDTTATSPPAETERRVFIELLHDIEVGVIVLASGSEKRQMSTWTWRLAPYYKKFEGARTKIEPVFTDPVFYATTLEGPSLDLTQWMAAQPKRGPFITEVVDGLRLALVRLRPRIQGRQKPLRGNREPADMSSISSWVRSVVKARKDTLLGTAEPAGVLQKEESSEHELGTQATASTSSLLKGKGAELGISKNMTDIIGGIAGKVGGVGKWLSDFEASTPKTLDSCTLCLTLLEYAFQLEPLGDVMERQPQLGTTGQTPNRVITLPKETFHSPLERRVRQAMKGTSEDPGTIFADFYPVPCETLDIGVERERQLLMEFYSNAMELLVVRHTRHHRHHLEVGDVVLSAEGGRSKILGPTLPGLEGLLDGQKGGKVALVLLRTVVLTKKKGASNTDLDNIKFSICYDNTTGVAAGKQGPSTVCVVDARRDDKLCIGDIVYFAGAPVTSEANLRASVKHALDVAGTVTLYIKRRVLFDVKKLGATGLIPVIMGTPRERSCQDNSLPLVVLRSSVQGLMPGDSLVNIVDLREYPLYGGNDPETFRKEAVYNMAFLQEILDYSIGVPLEFEWTSKTETLVVQEKVKLKPREVASILTWLSAVHHEYPELKQHLRFNALRLLSQWDVLLYTSVYVLCQLLGLSCLASSFFLAVPFFFVSPLLLKFFTIVPSHPSLLWLMILLGLSWVIQYGDDDISWLYWLLHQSLWVAFQAVMYTNFLCPDEPATSMIEPAEIESPLDGFTYAETTKKS